MPQRSYSYPSAVARLGQPGNTRAAHYARILKLLNPVLFAEKTETIGGTEQSDTYTISIESAALGLSSTSFSMTRTSENNAQIATALVAAAQAVEALQSLFTFTNPSSGVVNIKCKVPSVDFTVTDSVPAGATSTAATVVDVSNEQRIPLGRGVVEGSTAGQVALPTTSSELTDFKGITRYNEAALAANEGNSTVDGFPPGSAVGVQQDEAIWADAVESMTAGDHPHWLLSSGNEGKFGATLDGTAQQITITPTAEDGADFLMVVILDNGQSFPFALTTAASSATATTIGDQIRDAVEANPVLTKHLAMSGTTTTIFTSKSGVFFDVQFEESATTLAFAKAYTTPGVKQSHMLTDWEVAESTTGAGPVKLRKLS